MSQIEREIVPLHSEATQDLSAYDQGCPTHHIQPQMDAPNSSPENSFTTDATRFRCLCQTMHVTNGAYLVALVEIAFAASMFFWPLQSGAGSPIHIMIV